MQQKLGVACRQHFITTGDVYVTVITTLGPVEWVSHRNLLVATHGLPSTSDTKTQLKLPPVIYASPTRE